MNLSNENYKSFSEALKRRVKSPHFLKILDECRTLITHKRAGHNVIAYLLYRLNNKIIKKQYMPEPCHMLSDLKTPVWLYSF